MNSSLSSSGVTTRSCFLRRCRSRSRRAVAPNLLSRRGFSTATARAAARTSRTSHGQLTVGFYVVESSGGAEDLHRQARERNATFGSYEPRVLHVQAILPVLRDRMRVHREHHVLGELGLDALADLRELDHRHPDRVARDVAEVVAAIAEARRDR